MDYVFIPLTSLDIVDLPGVATVGIVHGWTIAGAGINPGHLDAAVGRVVRKWRLLAGSIEASPGSVNVC